MQIPRHESFRQGQSHLILLELRPGRHLRGRRVWSKMLLVLVNWSWISKQYRNLKIYIKSSWTIWHSKKVEHTHAFAFSFVVGVHVPAISKRRSPVTHGTSNTANCQKCWLSLSKVVYVETSAAFLFGARAGFALLLPLAFALAFALGGVLTGRGGAAAVLGAAFRFLGWRVDAGCDAWSRFQVDWLVDNPEQWQL